MCDAHSGPMQWVGMRLLVVCTGSQCTLGVVSSVNRLQLVVIYDGWLLKVITDASIGHADVAGTHGMNTRLNEQGSDDKQMCSKRAWMSEFNMPVRRAGAAE